jgi:Cft2 family RNA processing exonuclease
MYATINKPRLFATPRTIDVTEVVLRDIVKTYEAPRAVLLEHNSESAARDTQGEFAVSCREELAGLR